MKGEEIEEKGEGRGEKAAGEGRINAPSSGSPSSHHHVPPSPFSPLPSLLRPPPSAFRLLLDPPASGALNMAIDEALLAAAATSGQSTLRFYRWAEPTLSLGYFQPYADRWGHAASSESAAVRRSSGGGAILHDIELTYSIAVPNSHPLAHDCLGLYRAVHASLIAALAQWGVGAIMIDQSQHPGTCASGPAERWKATTVSLFSAAGGGRRFGGRSKNRR